MRPKSERGYYGLRANEEFRTVDEKEPNLGVVIIQAIILVGVVILIGNLVLGFN